MAGTSLMGSACGQCGGGLAQGDRGVDFRQARKAVPAKQALAQRLDAARRISSVIGTIW